MTQINLTVVWYLWVGKGLKARHRRQGTLRPGVLRPYKRAHAAEVRLAPGICTRRRLLRRPTCRACKASSQG